MKTTALLSTLIGTSLALPSTPHPFTPKKCPANPFQPTGKLPPGSISTSLLVPISASHPNTAYPASDWATVTPNDTCTIFNLELDSAAVQGKICSLVFDFPATPGLVAFSGPGTFTFTGYDINAGAVAGVTTYNNQPRAGPSPPFPPPRMVPGNSYVVNSAPCGIPAGIGKVTVSGALCSVDTVLRFRQSDLGCPLGFFVVLSEDPEYDGSVPH